MKSFLKLFNSIEEVINRRGNFTPNVSFYQKVNNLAATDYYYASIKEELQEIARLRNLLIHNDTIHRAPIAAPTEIVKQRMAEILREITYPPSVDQPSFIFEVLGAAEDDHLTPILRKMDEMNFSQFPVYKHGQVIEIVSTNTIARWMSRNIRKNGHLPSSNLRVKDLLPHIEYKHNYEFISITTDVFYAASLFQEAIINNGRNLDALFITNTSDNTEPLRGLITLADITPFIK